MPGVQEDYVAILRFDTEANLQAWLDSPVRKKLLEEAAPLTEEFHARMARTGFEQWFRDESPGGGGAVRLEDGHDRAAAALPDRLPVGRLRRHADPAEQAQPALRRHAVHRQHLQRRA